MRNTVVLLVAGIFSGVICSGCDQDGKSPFVVVGQIRRDAMAERAVQQRLSTSTNSEVLAWHKFLERWPSAQKQLGLAWYPNLNRFQGNTSALALIEDRYFFTSIVDFDVSADYNTVTFTKVHFHLAEVKRVAVPPEGRAEGCESVYFNPDQKWLTLEDWNRLVNANWNFGAIGIVVVSNTPVENIQHAAQGF